MAGSQTAIDLLVQRARPTLFSNALPTTVAASGRDGDQNFAGRAERVERLRANVERARSGIRDAGFEVLESPTPFVPSSWVIPPGPFVFRSGCLRRCFCDWLRVSRGPEGEARLAFRSARPTPTNTLIAWSKASGTQSRRRRLSVTLGGQFPPRSQHRWPCDRGFAPS